MKKSHKDIAKGKEKDSGQIIRKGVEGKTTVQLYQCDGKKGQLRDTSRRAKHTKAFIFKFLIFVFAKRCVCM